MYNLPVRRTDASSAGSDTPVEYEGDSSLAAHSSGPNVVADSTVSVE